MMSAYIVDEKTIYKIVTFLGREFVKDSYIRRIAYDFGVDVDTYEWRDKLVKRMHELNISAIEQRYHKTLTRQELTYVPILVSSKVEAFKALQCWLYQCMEGTIPETELYRYFRLL